MILLPSISRTEYRGIGRARRAAKNQLGRYMMSAGVASSSVLSFRVERSPTCLIE